MKQYLKHNSRALVLSYLDLRRAIGGVGLLLPLLLGPVGYLHSISGGVFFLTLAFYSLYHFPSFQGAKHEIAPHEAQRNFVYRTSGVVILCSLLAMGTYLFLIADEWKRNLNHYHFLFWMEWIAVWSFAAAWLTKGRAIVADIAVDMIALPSRLMGKREQ